MALQGVDLTVRSGEIHALMGENGAGKSTLIKVLTGVHRRDGGSVEIQGRAIHPSSPKDAEAAGISTVYQEVNLVPALSVAENIQLGRQPRSGPFIRWRSLRRRAQEALDRLGLGTIDVSRPVGRYSLAIQQMVAIARALDVEATRLLILDEPTSSLDEAEVAQLFSVMRKLRGDGLGLVFVTHFLDQVYAVCDRITVLRNGAGAGEFLAADLPRLRLVETMLGRHLEAGGAEDGGTGHRAAAGEGEGEVFLRASGLVRKGGVGPVDLTLRRGEAHGFAGLLGSGRTETARLLFGADRPTGGILEIKGDAAPLRSPRQAIARGIGFSSEDRKREGIIPTLSVRENLILAMQASRGMFRRIPRAEQSALAEKFIVRLGIRTPSPETAIENLSGGNQQKVVLARWLCMHPELLILDEPTRGIDVGTKAEIEKLVAELCGAGMAVVFISSELEEIVRTCSRVSVLRDLRKVGELEGDGVAVAPIMHTIAEPHARPEEGVAP
ncbi:sugar ABC transporter ATP-binding protein [soil metagenome]